MNFFKKNHINTQNLTSNTNHHSFNVGIAQDFSVATALFLDHVSFWTEQNLANDRNIHDGYSWTYNTIESFMDKFPYFSKSQIETMINNCEKQGLIIKGNYNKTKYDRTSWYALTPKGMFYFQHLLKEKYIKRLYASISEISEMDFREFRNRFPIFQKPIPDTLPTTENKESGGFSPTENSPSFFSEKFKNRLFGIDEETNTKLPENDSSEIFNTLCKTNDHQEESVCVPIFIPPVFVEDKIVSVSEDAFQNEETRKLFEDKFQGRKITYEQLFSKAKKYYTEEGKKFTPSKWEAWIMNEKLDRHEKISMGTDHKCQNDVGSEKYELLRRRITAEQQGRKVVDAWFGIGTEQRKLSDAIYAQHIKSTQQTTDTLKNKPSLFNTYTPKRQNIPKLGELLFHMNL